MVGQFVRQLAFSLIAFGCVSPLFAQQSSEMGILTSERPSDRGRVWIFSKPNPKSTGDLAIGSQFTIVLRAVLSADGKVRNIRFVKVTPNSLSKQSVKIFKERAMNAAKRIKFTPAEKDGRPVSIWVELEYSFANPKEDRPSALPGATEFSDPKDPKPKV